MGAEDARTTRSRVEAVINTARELDKSVQYPIRNFKQLSDALGGEDAEVVFEGKPRKVGHVRRLIPADYYPIDNAQELIAKIADLRARAEPGWPGATESGTELREVPPDAGRPTVADDFKPESGPSGNVPAVRGWRKGA